jgi:plasmid stability protein
MCHVVFSTIFLLIIAKLVVKMETSGRTMKPEWVVLNFHGTHHFEQLGCTLQPLWSKLSGRTARKPNMATLHVRNVPDKLYKRIHKLAEAENRSVTAEIIRLLSQGVQAREARKGVADVIDRIRRRAQKVELPRGWIDSAELIREDRNR